MTLGSISGTCTQISPGYDLKWIRIHPDEQGLGLGGQELWLRPVNPHGLEKQKNGEERQPAMENHEKYFISSFRGRDPNSGAGTAGLHRMEQCPKEENTVRSELTGEAGARSRATETQIQYSLPCPISSLKHRRGMSQKSSDGVLRYISHELWSY